MYTCQNCGNKIEKDKKRFMIYKNVKDLKD